MADDGHEDHGTEHLQMLYPEFVDRATRSQKPVTEIRELGKHRRIYSAAFYDPEGKIVWRADIDADHNPNYESSPSVKFAKCRPFSSVEAMQEWCAIATGRLSGPQDLRAWESLFTVFNAALGFYNKEVRSADGNERSDTDHAEGGTE